MSRISSVLRAIVVIAGLSALGTGAASACDGCTDHGYRDGARHDGYDGDRDGWRHGGYDGDRRDGDRDGYRDGGCRGDGCDHRYADGCRDNCYRHDDGCRDGCRRADYGCHDSCYRHDYGCHDGCYRRSANYSCYAGRFDCGFDDGCCDNGFRARYYDDRAVTYGGAYGIYDR
jgi:hypothetical protein